MSKLTESKPFVHLHVHTEFSLLDGAAKINELFKRAYELGQTAVAITDHGNMFGVIDFMKAAVKFTDDKADLFEFLEKGREFKVKPIIGIEVYVADALDKKESESGKMPKFNHLVLLAKDEEGYHNLVKLSSFAYTKGMYYKPRIDMNLLKQYAKGLICLSACLAGAIPQALLEGDLQKADAIAKEFQKLFGHDFYIELQDHNIKSQKTVLPHLIQIARQNGIKTVATNDVHYITKDDAAMQKVLQCISFRKTLSPDELDREDDSQNIADAGLESDGYFPTREFYLKSRSEMESVFPFIPEALDHTAEIAAKCKCNFFRKKPLLPQFFPETGETPTVFLRRLTNEGLIRNYGTVTAEMKTRADYELSVIEQMGFVEYFLIVWDFIYYAEKKRGIPVGPGRGSGVGSIVAYALGITKLDPLKYNLLFERFLNPERVSSPDFDIDFCVDRREEVIQYVIEKYGAENVSQIVTFGTLAAKAAVKDVGRVFSYPYSEVDKITKLMPFLMGKAKLSDLIGKGKLKDAVIPDLKELYEADPTVRRIFDMAMKVEGMPRQTGMHAAGVIICRDPIYEHVPLAKAKARGGEEVITTQFDMIECEALGLLKMDFLGLRTLTDIKNAQDIILSTKGETVDFYAMGYEDKGVFELIGEGDTHAVFQLESEGMKRFMEKLKPTLFEDIIAGVALYRPGPMAYIDAYCRGKRDPSSIRYDHPMMEPVLNVTYGIMVYQEQVMEAVRVLAGYTLGRADELRRMISKKKEKAMVAEREIFLHGDEKLNIPGAVKNGVPLTVANKIWDDIVKFADYAFNKSHAAAYAVLAYQTAYLKRYYTVEYITAVLNNRIANIDEIANYLRYLKEKGIAVLPPDINQSLGKFSVENGSVRIGMAAIKNVGTGVIDEIVAERKKNGNFLDFEDFVRRMDSVSLNKRMLESLILSGTFDCFGNARAQLMQVFDGVLARAAKDKQARLSGQFSFFDTGTGFGHEQRLPYPKVREFDWAVKLQHEKDVAGVYLTGHPLDEYREFLSGFSVNSSHFAAAAAESGGGEDETMEVLEGEAASGYLTDGQVVLLGGMLVAADKRFTKAGRELGIGKLEDLNGTVEILISEFVLKKCRAAFVKDKLVTVRGKVKERDGSWSLWADTVTEFREGAKTVRNKKIYFHIDKTDELLIEELREILRFYPGNDEVRVQSTHDNVLYPLDIRVAVSDSLLTEVYGLVPAEKVKIIE